MCAYFSGEMGMKTAVFVLTLGVTIYRSFAGELPAILSYINLIFQFNAQYSSKINQIWSAKFNNPAPRHLSLELLPRFLPHQDLFLANQIPGEFPAFHWRQKRQNASRCAKNAKHYTRITLAAKNYTFIIKVHVSQWLLFLFAMWIIESQNFCEYSCWRKKLHYRNFCDITFISLTVVGA